MVFLAKSKVDGFALADVAVDHGILVQAGAGFDQAEAGRVPCELDESVGEEGRSGAVGEEGFIKLLICHQNLLVILTSAFGLVSFIMTCDMSTAWGLAGFSPLAFLARE